MSLYQLVLGDLRPMFEFWLYGLEEFFLLNWLSQLSVTGLSYGTVPSLSASSVHVMGLC